MNLQHDFSRQFTTTWDYCEYGDCTQTLGVGLQTECRMGGLTGLEVWKQRAAAASPVWKEDKRSILSWDNRLFWNCLSGDSTIQYVSGRNTFQQHNDTTIHPGGSARSDSNGIEKWKFGLSWCPQILKIIAMSYGNNFFRPANEPTPNESRA
jgi:hypothetical protein